ncbi:MAG: SxtJ family membrane protein [Candidatus Alcyoniella australis]|nr:SxtJ family membrane protein [Candidatus Alcyoniella australis]
MAQLSDKELKARIAERKQIIDFGVLLTGFLGLLACISAYKHGNAWPYLVGIGAGLGLLGLVFPKGLTPLYRVWMKLAMGLGWFTTRLVLTVFFFLVLTPSGLLARLLRADLIEKKFDKSAPTYWLEFPKRDYNPELYERRF